MAILSKGTTYADGTQVTATNLNALVDSATFASGAYSFVHNPTGSLNAGGQDEFRIGGVSFVFVFVAICIYATV